MRRGRICLVNAGEGKEGLGNGEDSSGVDKACARVIQYFSLTDEPTSAVQEHKEHL